MRPTGNESAEGDSGVHGDQRIAAVDCKKSRRDEAIRCFPPRAVYDNATPRAREMP
jgi:hypothetical protein